MLMVRIWEKIRVRECERDRDHQSRAATHNRIERKAMRSASVVRR
jgi:hypothetical protein